MALRKADILQDRRDGRYIYYRLANASLLNLILDFARLSGLDPESISPHINTEESLLRMSALRARSLPVESLKPA